MLNVGTNFLIQAVERLGLVEHPSHSDGISSKTPDGDMELRGRNRTWRATSPEELAEGKTAIVDLEYVHVTRVKKPEDQADCRRREQSTMSMEEFRKYRIEVTDFAYTRDGPSRKVDKFTDHWTPLDELEAKEHCNVDFAQVQNASLKKQGHWVARPRKAESMPTAEEVKESEADRNGVSKLAESNRVAHLFMAACDLRIEEEEGLLVFHVPVDAQDKEVESRKDSWRIVLASKLVSRRTSTSSSATDTRTSSPPPSSSRPDDNSSRAKPRRCPPPVLSIIHRNREHRTPLRSFAHLPAGASPSLQMYRTLRDVMRSWSEIKRTQERFVVWEREAPCLLGVKLMLRKQDDEVIKGLADVPEILWASTLQKAIAEDVRSTLDRDSWWDEVN